MPLRLQSGNGARESSGGNLDFYDKGKIRTLLW